MITLTEDDLTSMDSLFRVQFSTSLPGAKPISLIGTTDLAGKTNLAPFSSIVHLGSTPCFLGMVSRPNHVDRHTLANLVETRSWTINHLHTEILEAAHQCAAKYPKDVSEFDATHLTAHYVSGFVAPFVAESRLRVGLELEDIIHIPANETQLIVGRVVLVQMAEKYLMKHGGIDLIGMDCLASTALDTYFQLQPLARLSHATPESTPRRI